MNKKTENIYDRICWVCMRRCHVEDTAELAAFSETVTEIVKKHVKYKHVYKNIRKGLSVTKYYEIKFIDGSTKNTLFRKFRSIPALVKVEIKVYGKLNIPSLYVYSDTRQLFEFYAPKRRKWYDRLPLDCKTKNTTRSRWIAKTKKVVK